ncbi:MAG: hypothetical protein Kow0063_34030 [Anaerolineae bacterium]
MGPAHAQFVSKRSPWLADEQIIQGQECATPQRNWPEQDKRQDKERKRDQDILPGYARAQCTDS